MMIRVCTFTPKGQSLAEGIFSEEEWFPEYRREETLENFVADSFRKRLPILFIGAMGIAVRAIAPFVKDKLTDSPVLVMDEAGQYVIPVLSGHIGMANDLAELVAKKAGSIPIITTATDVEKLFAVDVFARRNGLHIVNREGIRSISMKVLRGEQITVAVSEGFTYEKEALPTGFVIVPWEKAQADIRIARRMEELKGKEACIVLMEKAYILGIGCKKGKRFEELLEFLQQQVPYDLEKDIRGIASIDLKKREKGLMEIAQYLHVPFKVFSGEELQAVEGDFSESSFVLEKTGVSNVCERAALKMATEESISLAIQEQQIAECKSAELVMKKVAQDGMTLAIAGVGNRKLLW